jgi:hypothetical protein
LRARRFRRLEVAACLAQISCQLRDLLGLLEQLLVDFGLVGLDLGLGILCLLQLLLQVLKLKLKAACRLVGGLRRRADRQDQGQQGKQDRARHVHGPTTLRT